MATAKQIEVREALMRLICKIGPGGILPSQDQLYKQMKVSRTLVRENISIFEYLNIVHVRTKTGTVITPIEAWHTTNADVVRWKTLVN